MNPWNARDVIGEKDVDLIEVAQPDQQLEIEWTVHQMNAENLGQLREVASDIRRVAAKHRDADGNQDVVTVSGEIRHGHHPHRLRLLEAAQPRGYRRRGN